MALKRTAVILVGCVAAGIYAAGASGLPMVGFDEVKVTLEEVPAAVKATILRESAGGEILELERVTTKDRVQYEAEIKFNDKVIDLEVATDGTILQKVVEDEEDEEGQKEGEEDEREEGEGEVEGGLEKGKMLNAAFSLRLGSIPTPLKDGAQFSAKITHPYLPLSAVRYAELRGTKSRVIREVQPQTRVVSGVGCLVLAEKEYEGDVLEEISYNYFAQDEKGNVYYFGEDVDEYKDGQVVSHGGAWIVGKNAAEPCLFMPAEPTVGFQFKPENSPPDAEEWAEVALLDARFSASGKEYKDVLIIRETDSPTRWEEAKYYAKGVGLISENGKLNVVSVQFCAGVKDENK